MKVELDIEKNKEIEIGCLVKNGKNIAICLEKPNNNGYYKAMLLEGEIVSSITLLKDWNTGNSNRISGSVMLTFD